MRHIVIWIGSLIILMGVLFIACTTEDPTAPEGETLSKASVSIVVRPSFLDASDGTIQQAEVEVTVLDGQGDPMGGKEVDLNLFPAVGAGKFVDDLGNDVIMPVVTDGNGNVIVTYEYDPNDATYYGYITLYAEVTIKGQLYEGSVMVQVILGLPPSVSSVTPSEGPDEGGCSVTITGSNFVDGLTVSFGGEAATVTNVSVAGDAIDVQTPEYIGLVADGTIAVVVSVVNPDGQSDTGSYTYKEALDVCP